MTAIDETMEETIPNLLQQENVPYVQENILPHNLMVIKSYI
jgi:hypothetical protein